MLVLFTKPSSRVVFDHPAENNKSLVRSVVTPEGYLNLKKRQFMGYISGLQIINANFSEEMAKYRNSLRRKKSGSSKLAKPSLLKPDKAAISEMVNFLNITGKVSDEAIFSLFEKKTNEIISQKLFV